MTKQVTCEKWTKILKKIVNIFLSLMHNANYEKVTKTLLTQEVYLE